MIQLAQEVDQEADQEAVQEVVQEVLVVMRLMEGTQKIGLAQMMDVTQMVTERDLVMMLIVEMPAMAEKLQASWLNDNT